MDKEKGFVSFVVYTHNNGMVTNNNGTEITDFLNKMYAYGSENFENFEMICVDDGSVDNTVDLIKNFVSEGRSVTVVDMGFHQGLELAMNAGVDFAIGDFVFEFDSVEITYDMSVISEIFHECLEGSDIVAACPDTVTDHVSGLFYKLFNAASKTQYRIQTDSFRILSRRAINRVRSMSSVLPYRKAVYANCGLVMKNHMYSPVSEEFRKRDSAYRLGLAIDAFVLYTDIAYKLASFFTILMLLMTVGISIYALVVRMQGIPIEGWTSTVLIICVGFFGISLLIAILIKYTALILQTVFMHHKYIVKSVDRISR